MRRLQRGDWTVEVEPTMWAAMLNFLGSCGWQPGIPIHYLLASPFEVSNDVARSLAQAGEVALDETMKNPLQAFSTIKFDLGKFAEIVEFAAHGAFDIGS